MSVDVPATEAGPGDEGRWALMLARSGDDLDAVRISPAERFGAGRLIAVLPHRPGARGEPASRSREVC